MRTGFSAWRTAGAVLALGTTAVFADDGGAAPSPAAAPTMQDYRDRDAMPGSPLPASGAPDLSMPAPVPTQEAPSIAKPEDANWLQKGVDAERKASEARQSGKPVDSPLKSVDPLAPQAPALAKPLVQADPSNDPAKLKPAKGADGIVPLVPAAPKTADTNQLKPLIQGLSSDAMKPLATGTTTNSPTALSNFKSVEAVNPDLTRPLYLDRATQADNSSAAYGTAPSMGGSAMAGLPSGYEIPNAPPSRPLGAAPVAGAAPLAPIAPLSGPAGSSALSSFSPIQPITAPTAPAVPQAPSARDLAPKAGPGSAMKLKDPVSADLPFIR